MADPMRIRAQVAGDKATVRVLMSHEMETGQRKDSAGKLIPAWFIQDVTASHNGKQVLSAQWGPSVSKNPFCSSPSRAPRPATRSPSPGPTTRATNAPTKPPSADGVTHKPAGPCIPRAFLFLTSTSSRHVGDNVKKTTLVGVALLALAASAQAQKSAADGIAEYRKMLEDGNPAELFEAKGEDLWKQKRGPKNASLERCDLGKGPGVVKGAFVTLPRYFADTRRRVQDLESRLVTCMEKLQGFNGAEIAKTAFGRGEQNNVTALATWIATMSRGMKFNLPQGHAEERASTNSASVSSSSAAARMTSPAPVATPKTASASACRTCPT
jgi:thiosulfate oxidation carrier complex protein SoxZ